MHRQTAAQIQADLVHGHSRITWLMDDITAHLTAWIDAPEAGDLILDELVVYWAEFRDSLREHIIEEETELFPLVSTYAGFREATALSRLHAQHSTLRAEIAAVDALLVDLLGAEVGERHHFAPELAQRTRQLRSELSAHSHDERDFLRGVENYISDGCLSS